MREEFLEEAFILQYHLNMSYSDIREMPLPYRRWFIEWLTKEFKKQAEARKKESDDRQGLVDIPMGDMAAQVQAMSQNQPQSPMPSRRSTKFSKG